MKKTKLDNITGIKELFNDNTLTSFFNVSVGDEDEYLESNKNLSYDKGWVFKNARVKACLIDFKKNKKDKYD